MVYLLIDENEQLKYICEFATAAAVITVIAAAAAFDDVVATSAVVPVIGHFKPQYALEFYQQIFPNVNCLLEFFYMQLLFF